ncbi:MAG TPA: PhzF family phenazine biosynthesis protein [Candidatus Bathyarchaeia archaeon]|nr:PhzF family phenazine biosynthesis protein [Candidatus Bathyarchaeia archaeon]
MTAPIPVLQADVFTDRPFAGNPAAAVLDADGLDAPAMQRIAGEMAVPGTAFVSASSRPDADWALRMFTPRREVGYSGHTSLCGTHALIEAGRLPGPRVTFDTPSGLLRVEVERDGAGALMWLEPALPTCTPLDGGAVEILDALGLPRAGLAGWARPAVTPDADLLLPVRDLATLRAIEPDMRRLAALRTAQQGRGVCVVSRETVDPGSSTHSRFFAPHYGLPEDIVTGSVHTALGVWLLEAGALLVVDGRAVFTAEQGDGLGRPGRIRVELTVTGGRASRARVGGRAVTVLSGSLRPGG